jgi:hypothetical protein
MGVGDEGARVDRRADPEFVARYSEIAKDPNDGGRHPDRHVVRASAGHELAIALVSGQRGREPDDEGNAEAGQILGSLVAVGVALGRWLLAHPEAEEHDRRSAHVRKVMDRIAEKTHRAGQDRDRQLDQPTSPSVAALPSRRA